MASVETSISSSVDYHDTWIVDSRTTSHMTRKYGVFQMIEEITPGHFVETDIGNPQAEIRGVETLKFQLELGEIIEVSRVLFVPCMKVRRLPMLFNVLRRRMKTKREQHHQKYQNMLPNLKRNFLWH